MTARSGRAALPARLAQVKHWVRNVDRTYGAYRLPTATDYFYPDFVAELTEGRQLVIEYKRRLDDDSAEKDYIGLKAEETSGGKLLFLMAVKRDAAGRGNVRNNLKADFAHSGSGSFLVP